MTSNNLKFDIKSFLIEKGFRLLYISQHSDIFNSALDSTFVFYSFNGFSNVVVLRFSLEDDNIFICFLPKFILSSLTTSDIIKKYCFASVPDIQTLETLFNAFLLFNL